MAIDSPNTSVWEDIQRACEAVDGRCGAAHRSPQVGVVLGSGLGAFGKRLADEVAIPYAEIPGFSRSGVQGHTGELVLGRVGAVRCAVMRGRAHYYEGHSMARVTFPVRVLAGMGVRSLLLTNAAGGVNPAFEPGDLMVIADHLNLTGHSPLRGPNDDRLGPRFPDMSEAYPRVARAVLHRAARDHGATAREGIYAGLCGPNYETPAEVRMLDRLGADAVGMSTVAETTVACHAGMTVAGLSVITNVAAGLSTQPLSHEEVTATGERVRELLCDILWDAVQQLPSVAQPT